ncbi:MAG: PRC-barrel domain-containing protein [Caldilineaceae bacterium]
MKDKFPLPFLGLLLVLALTLGACEFNDGAGIGEPAVEDPEIVAPETEIDASLLVTESEALTDTDAVSPEITTDEAITDTDVVTTTGAVTQAPTTEEATDAAMANAPDALILGYAFLDQDFINADGEVSGEIEDLLIDLSNGRILFAAIEYGGFLDIGDREIVVPLNAFTWQPLEDDLVLNFDEQALQQFPDVGSDWPDFNDPAWDDEVSTFWRDVGVDPGFDFAAPATTAVWAEDMLGYSLVDLGVGVGTIQNMLIDLTNSRVKYLLVGFGTTAAEDAPFMIPLSAVDVTAIDNTVTGNEIAFDTNFTLEILQTAPRFDRILFDTVGEVDPVLDDAADQYWEEQGYAIGLEE